MVSKQRDRTLEERLEDLENRLAVLESSQRFCEHIQRVEFASCGDIIREWFKTHSTLHLGQFYLETGGLYSRSAIRMAAHRMYMAGEIARAGWGMYSYLREVPRATDNCRALTPAQIEEIRQDTTSTHAWLAAKYSVSPSTIVRAGHGSSRSFSKEKRKLTW